MTEKTTPAHFSAEGTNAMTTELGRKTTPGIYLPRGSPQTEHVRLAV